MAIDFGRSWYAIVGDVRIDPPLRIKFKVTRKLIPEPNPLDLHIYNLSEITRARIQKKGVPVVVCAGYQANAEVIFAGTVRTIDQVRERADWATHVVGADGVVVFDGAKSTISLAAGATVQDQLARIIQDLTALNTRDAVAAIRAGTFTFAFPRLNQGYSARGPTVKILEQALKPHGIRWSIQNGTLQLLQGSTPLADTAFLLSPSTGLIGSPDHGAPETPGKPAYIKLQSLLQPAIRPGRVVRLATRSFRGDYTAQNVVHEGDSHGMQWTTGIEALPR